MTVKLKAEHKNITLKKKKIYIQYDTNVKPVNSNTGNYI
jgi:hypothetical protein